jgi:hypothetical protein
MGTALAYLAQPLQFDRLQQIVLVKGAVGRLLMACTLGAVVGVERDTIGGLQRVSFGLTATKKQHERLHGQLLAEPEIDALHTFRDPEED